MIEFYEDNSIKYSERTRKNIQYSTATVAFAVDYTTAGEKCTAKYAKELKKPFLQIQLTTQGNVKTGQNTTIYNFTELLKKQSIVKLNIAGNDIYTLAKNKITQKQIDDVIKRYIAYLLKNNVNIQEIRSGGQTGADEAGLKAAASNEIRAICVAPQGWKFRDIHGKDISDEKLFKKRFAYVGIVKKEIDTPRNFECKPCTCLMQDTYEGILSDYIGNNKNLHIGKPIEYMNKIKNALNKKNKQKGSQPYKVSIKVNPKDNRIFLSAEFSYGKRKITYTNVSSLPRIKTNENNIVCIQENHITAKRIIALTTTFEQYAKQNEPTWLKKGYKGSWYTYKTGDKTHFRAKYEMKSGQSTLDFEIIDIERDGQIMLSLVQNQISTNKINQKTNPKTWVKETHDKLIKQSYHGYMENNINRYGKLVIYGKYSKTEYLSNGSNYTEIIFYNTAKQPDIPKLIPNTDNSNPAIIHYKGKVNEDGSIKKITSNKNIRTFMQDDDDNYTPEKKPKRTAINNQIHKEVEEYNVEKKLYDEAGQYRLQAKKIKERIQRDESYAKQHDLWKQAEELERKASAIERHVSKRK